MTTSPQPNYCNSIDVMAVHAVVVAVALTSQPNHRIVRFPTGANGLERFTPRRASVSERVCLPLRRRAAPKTFQVLGQ